MDTWKLQLNQLADRLIKWVTNSAPKKENDNSETSDTSHDSTKENTPAQTAQELDTESRPTSFDSENTQDSYPVIPLVRHPSTRQHVRSRVVLVGAAELFDETIERVV